jgi:UDP-glucose 4-epimerase
LKRILVTGGAGFIGSNLVSKLHNKHEIIVLDNFSTGLKSNLTQLNVKIRNNSILDTNELNNIFDQKIDVVVHLAALGSVPRSIIDPRSTFENNVIGTFELLERARINGSHFIFASSSSVYGSNLESPKNEKTWLSPISPYGASKLSGEALVTSYAAALDLKVSSFRFFNVFGPKQRHDHLYAAVIPKWIFAALNNLELEVFGDGEQTRDFTFVDDLIHCLESTIDNETTFDGTLNLAYGTRLSLNEILKFLIKQFPNLKCKYLPSRKGDIKDSTSNPANFRKIFGEIPHTDFEKAIEITINWLKSYI